MKQIADLLYSDHQALAEMLIKSTDSQHLLVQMLWLSESNCKIRDFLASTYCTLELIEEFRTYAYILYMQLLCETNSTPFDTLLMDKIIDTISTIERYRKYKL